MNSYAVRGPISTPSAKAARSNKKFLSAIVIGACILVLTGAILWTRFPTPHSSQLHSRSPFSHHEDEDSDVPCTHIASNEDPCKFVRENPNCEVEGLIPWLEFRYCWLPKQISKTSPTAPKTSHIATALTSALMTFALIIGLNALGDTADTFFVTALQSVATELKLSPVVAGISLVALGNASPDLASSISAVKAGDIPLVMGSLAGACVCISLLVLGAALVSAPKGETTLPKPQFIRSVIGYAVSIGFFIVLTARGELRLWASLLLIGVYAVYLICNVVYLQQQESKLNKMRENDRRLKFVEEFKNRSISQDQIQAIMGVNSGKKHGLGPSHGMTLNSSDEYNTPLLGAGDDSAGYGSTANQNSCDSHTTTGIYSTKSDQTKEESRFVDLDVINTVDLATEKQHHQHQHCHQGHGHHDSNNDSSTGLLSVQTSSLNPEPLSDDCEDSNIDETVYMAGISWPNPDWEVETSCLKVAILKILWVFTSPFSFAKWITIPATDCRPDYLGSLKLAFSLVSPALLSCLILFIYTDAFSEIDSFEKDILKGPLMAFPLTGLGLTVILALFYFFLVKPRISQYYTERDAIRTQIELSKSPSSPDLSTADLAHLAHLHLQYDLDKDDCDTKPGLLTFYQIVIALIAFTGSITWLSFLADEVVNVLASLGLMFGISSTVLGVLLSIGNSLPDLVAGVSLAAKGKIGISYAAVFGAPVLSSTFGLGISILLKFIQTDPETGKAIKVLTFAVTKQLWLCLGVTIGALVLHCIIYPWTKFTPPKAYGYFLVAAYAVFLLVTVLFEVWG